MAATEAGTVDFRVSIDGGLQWFGETKFTFTGVPTLTALSTNIVGRDLIQNITVSGSDLIAPELLAAGHPICRFNFSQTGVSRVTVSQPAMSFSDHLLCTTPSATPDSSVSVEVSFNGQ